MTSVTTITELRTMQIGDLRKELRAQQTHVQKMRMQITMNTEKDTGRYRREKKQLARMMMIMGEKAQETKATKETKATEGLKKKAVTATVSVSRKPKKTEKRSS